MAILDRLLGPDRLGPQRYTDTDIDCAQMMDLIDLATTRSTFSALNEFYQLSNELPSNLVQTR